MMRISELVSGVGAVSVVLLTACYGGDDPATPDATIQPDVTVQVDTGGTTCGKAVDGTPCGQAGSGNICRGGACVASYCGDGFVDDKANEECEDGNQDDGDGCTQCRFDCKLSSDCDDKESCNGAETCEAGTHKCLDGITASDKTVCKMGDGKAGTCKAGACVSAGCGDGVKNGTEECDDGNAVPKDGCENDCTWTCEADADCDDTNPCTGKETCDKSVAAKPVCKAGTKVVCTHKNCTGTCQSADGKCLYPDADKDGVDCRTDCNEKDAAIYPGAPECQDGKDNDCDPNTADGKDGSCVCWKDGDGDSYAAVTAATVPKSGNCPAGYTARDPTVAGSADCWDSNKYVFPGQTVWFTSPFCKGTYCFNWDYNCNGQMDKRYPSLKGTCQYFKYGKIVTCFGAGWTGSSVPLCGAEAYYAGCVLSGTTCTTSKYIGKRKQECR